MRIGTMCLLLMLALVSRAENIYTLTYYNTDGSEIGTQEVDGDEQQTIGEFKYGASDVTVRSGYAFRGWFTASSGGKKVLATDKVESDMSLYAVATAIEVADNESAYTYDLTGANFDPADHECIEISDGGSYYNEHGWTFADGQTIKLKVGGYATIGIGACEFSDGNDITITDADGKEVGKLMDYDTTDGAIHTFEYEGEATTLTLTFAGRAYIHSVSIKNYLPETGDPVLATITINGQRYTVADLFKDAYEVSLEISKKTKMVSESNPVTATAENGKVGTITYDGDDTQCVVTIPVSVGDNTQTYKLSLTQKPDYALTYYDTDEVTILGMFVREKDETIGKFDIESDEVTVEEGFKMRGWYHYNNGVATKYTTDMVITDDIELYAVETEIEEASTHKRYTFNLTDPSFDPENHEAFNPTGGKWADSRHGWAFRNGDKIDLLVGPKANIYVTICNEGEGANDIIITNEDGDSIGSVPGSSYEVADGEIVSYSYEGEAGTITLHMNCTAEMYIHAVRIVNTAETTYEQYGNWYCVKPGDIRSLRDALDAVNDTNLKINAPRAYIYLPNGVYDLGKTVKTAITAHNVSLIGQSMEQTVITTMPELTAEGLGSADLLQSKGRNLYVQDLTLQNTLDYYNAETEGRAAVIQDAGNRSIFKNVKMLSMQNTYYNSSSGQSYLEDCDIHGAVDLISGNGDVRFQNTTITLEPRTADGSGSRTITAPEGTVSFGLVLDGCRIVDNADGKGTWNFGRAGEDNPISVFLNTTLDEHAQATLIPARWTEKGANGQDPYLFGEYNTMDADGANITPETHTITGHSGIYQTILSASQADYFSYSKMFADNYDKRWNPTNSTAQVAAPADAKYENGTVSWTAVDKASAYAIFQNDSLLTVTTDTSFDYELKTAEEEGEEVGLTIRSANTMGGLGAAAQVDGTTAILPHRTETELGRNVIYNLQGVRVGKPGKGIYIINGKKTVIK